MTDFKLPSFVYLAGAIAGAVMVITSLVMLIAQPGSAGNVAQYAQNNAQQPQLLKYYTGADGGYVWVTPTPCVVSSYVVTADSCK